MITKLTEEAVPTLYFEGALRVNIYDIDLAGIVHNVVFVRWLEDLRVGWCDTYLPLTEQLADGYLPILASTEIEYKAPIRFGVPVIGKLRMTTKRVRWMAEFEIWAGGTLAATARQTGAFVNKETLKPIPVPSRLTEQYENTSVKIRESARWISSSVDIPAAEVTSLLFLSREGTAATPLRDVYYGRP